MTWTTSWSDGAIALVRYADDIRVYVASERAATRVIEGVTVFVEQRLRLKVNRAKSGVAPATRRGLLGFGFFRRDGQGEGQARPEGEASPEGATTPPHLPALAGAMTARLAALGRFLGWLVRLLRARGRARIRLEGGGSDGLIV